MCWLWRWVVEENGWRPNGDRRTADILAVACGGPSALRALSMSAFSERGRVHVNIMASMAVVGSAGVGKRAFVAG